MGKRWAAGSPSAACWASLRHPCSPVRKGPPVPPPAVGRPDQPQKFCIQSLARRTWSKKTALPWRCLPRLDLKEGDALGRSTFLRRPPPAAVSLPHHVKANRHPHRPRGEEAEASARSVEDWSRYGPPSKSSNQVTIRRRKSVQL